MEKQGCTATYTWEKLKSAILYMYEQNMSLRGVAREFGPPVNHADIQRILRGIEPRDPHKRLRLGLPALGSAPVCAKCGELHVTRRCTKAAAQPKRVKPRPASTTPKIKGQPYTIKAVIPWAWIAPAHPAGPPLVVVEMREGQK